MVTHPHSRQATSSTLSQPSLGGGYGTTGLCIEIEYD